jgi:hypothetical protein
VRARTTPRWNRSSRCCRRMSWTVSGGPQGKNCGWPSRPGSKGPTTAEDGKDGWENSRPSNVKQSTGPRSQRPKTPSQQEPGQSPVLGYSFQQQLARRERCAGIYSEALRAVEDYLEAPYLIRRRDGSALTRTALTKHVSDIQSRIAYYSALLQIHAPEKVSLAYNNLVQAARSEAGPKCP